MHRLLLYSVSLLLVCFSWLGPAAGGQRPAAVTFVMFHDVPSHQCAGTKAVFLDAVGKLRTAWNVAVVVPRLETQKPALYRVGSRSTDPRRLLSLGLGKGLRRAAKPLPEIVAVKSLFKMSEELSRISKKDPGAPDQPRVIIVGDSLPSGRWVEFALQRMAVQGFDVTFLHTGAIGAEAIGVEAIGAEAHKAGTPRAPGAKEAAALASLPGCTVRRTSLAGLSAEVTRVLAAPVASKEKLERTLAANRRAVRKSWSNACSKESIRCVRARSSAHKARPKERTIRFEYVLGSFGTAKGTRAAPGRCRPAGASSRKAYVRRCVRMYERYKLEKWAYMLERLEMLRRGRMLGLRWMSGGCPLRIVFVEQSVIHERGLDRFAVALAHP